MIGQSNRQNVASACEGVFSEPRTTSGLHNRTTTPEVRCKVFAQSAIERLEAPLLFAWIVTKEPLKIALCRRFLSSSQLLKYLQGAERIVKGTAFGE